MKKKIVALILIMILLPINRNVFADEEMISDVAHEANKKEALVQMKKIVGADNNYNQTVPDDYSTEDWIKYGLLVPKADDAEKKSINPNANDLDNGEYRYLGVSPDGNMINNPLFPPDNEGNAEINSYDWQVNRNEATQIINFYTDDQATTVTQLIIDELIVKYPTRFNTNNIEEIMKSVEVIVPPTDYSKGVFRIMHKWDSNRDGIPEDWYITINTEAGGDDFIDSTITLTPPPVEVIAPPTGGSDITYTSSTTTYSDLSSNPIGVIAADNKGAEKFNASTAIPSSESLYVDVSAKPYLHTETYSHIQGQRTYTVTVTKDYTLTRWVDLHHKIDGNDDGDYDDVEDIWVGDWEYDGPHTVTKYYTVNRQFSLYLLDSYHVQGLSSATISNGALPGGSVTTGSIIGIPSVTASQSSVLSHIIDPVPSGTVTINLGHETFGNSTTYPSLPNPNWQSVAEGNVSQFQVSNDTFVFNGSTIMSGAWHSQNTPAPLAIPNASVSNVINQSGLVIPTTHPNGVNPSSGTVVYTTIGGSGVTTTASVSGLENVTVHTPVVAYPSLGPISRESQGYIQDENEKQLVVEEQFQISYPTEGQHIESVGYGYKDYSPYTSLRQINFPFDVYLGDDYQGDYLARNQWHTIDDNDSQFFIPMWASEQQGIIRFRTIPLNIPDMSSQAYEFHANLDRNNYKAVDTIEFNLVGKMMGFTVNDCYDDTWSDYFETHRMYAGMESPNLPLSLLEDGMSEEHILPIMPDKTVITKDAQYLKNGDLLDGVMLGYPIEFSMATNGDVFGTSDYLIIKPTFEFVPKISGVSEADMLMNRIDMSQRQEVDVYVDKNQRLEHFTGELLLSEDDRTFIGKTSIGPSSISDFDKQVALQRWDGTFYLPNMSYFVPKGIDLSAFDSLDLEEAPFLHEGYIIVRFEIYVQKSVFDNDLNGIKNNSPTYEESILERLLDEGYIPQALYGVGWELEGYQIEQEGIELKYGDVIFYMTDMRASETYY